MRTRTGWLAVLLTAGICLAPSGARGQFDSPADPVWPLPLWHEHPETGGFYLSPQFYFMRQSNPIKHQIIAWRGFSDTDGSVAVAVNQTAGAMLPVTPGAFFGSKAVALDSEQVSGPGTYSPGFGIALGGRFGQNSSIDSVEFRYRHFVQARYSAVASLLPKFNADLTNPSIGLNLENTFLFSPVYNFPPEWAGPFNKIGVVNPFAAQSGASVVINPAAGGTSTTTVNGTTIMTSVPLITISANNNGAAAPAQAAFGIWNGAGVEVISFTQRYDDYDLIGRIPMYQNDCVRCYGTIGPRHVSLWERFQWRATALASALPSATATVTTGAITGPVFTSTTTNTGAGSTTIVNFSGFTIPAITVTAGAQAQPIPGNSSPQDVAIYSNITSNQLWGPQVGWGAEYYVGHGVACQLDLRAAAFVDFVREIDRYELGDRSIANKRAKRDYSISPDLGATFSASWYPIEGVELRAGYDLDVFFNTFASPQPVDFNYGSMDPTWNKHTTRYLDGFNFGIAFVF